jgi:acetyl-CoA acyltransferase
MTGEEHMSQNTKNHAVIVDYARTAFAKAAIPGSGKAPGRLADLDAVDLQIPLINALLERTGLDPNRVESVLTGCVHQEEVQGLNIARLNVLSNECNLPHSVCGSSVDMFCASSLKALHMAAGFTALDPDNVYICTGVQSMSRVPMGGINPQLNKNIHTYEGDSRAFMNMATTAENLAELHGITRAEQDAFTVRSHQLHASAADAGRFEAEIIPVKGLAYDDGVRRDTTVEGLARLKPVARAAEAGGTVTAGTASQITDGATAAIVTSEAFARENNLPVLARMIAFGEAGCAPEIMGIGPVEASRKALKKAGLTLADMDFIELNEAFAAQSLSVIKEWEKQGMAPDISKINVNGGAIAMGHPLGATGIRLAGTLALELKKANKRYGLATLCIGGGQGMALIIENPDFQP